DRCADVCERCRDPVRRGVAGLLHPGAPGDESRSNCGAQVRVIHRLRRIRREEICEICGWIGESMLQDIRYGIRMLLKKPGFTLVAVLSLALGIGANTAIFSLLDAVLIKTLPVQEPQQLVLFGKGLDQGASIGPPIGNVDLFSYPFYRQVQQRTDMFSGVASLLSMTWPVHGFVNSSSDIEQLEVQLVSGSYFPVLGVNAGLGRVLTEADDQNQGGHPVAVVSYAWWQHRLGGDPAVIGRTLKIDDITYNIVGVAPKEFFGTTVGSAPDLWIPLSMEKQLPPA